MTLQKLPYNFHDAEIASIIVGPRREVTLVVPLDDPDHAPHHAVYIRFGGITNLSEVTSFMERVPGPKVPGAYWTRIETLDYDTGEQSRENSLVFRLVFDQVGQVLIRCRNITTGTGNDPNNQA